MKTQSKWKYALAYFNNAPCRYVITLGKWGSQTIATCDKEEDARLIATVPELLAIAELHANQCSEWAARMELSGNAEEAAAYRKDEQNARSVIAKATTA